MCACLRLLFQRKTCLLSPTPGPFEQRRHELGTVKVARHDSVQMNTGIVASKLPRAGGDAETLWVS